MVRTLFISAMVVAFLQEAQFVDVALHRLPSFTRRAENVVEERLHVG